MSMRTNQLEAKMEVSEILKKIDGDTQLKDKFLARPEDTLKSMGVDTSGLSIKKFKEGDPIETTRAISVCGSIGAVAGVSVGGDV
jgi:hypothetical protein